MKIVIIDSDAIIALFNDKDSNSKRAMDILQELNKNGITIIYPATTIVEVITTLQRKIHKPKIVKAIVELIKNGNLPIESVNGDIILKSFEIFNPDGSKKDTLFDAVVATIAKKYTADAIFSFDKGYKKLGFKLITDIL